MIAIGTVTLLLLLTIANILINTFADYTYDIGNVMFSVRHHDRYHYAIMFIKWKIIPSVIITVSDKRQFRRGTLVKVKRLSAIKFRIYNYVYRTPSCTCWKKKFSRTKDKTRIVEDNGYNYIET